MKELENQLHEQYATNANNNVGTVMTLATSSLAVLAMYGYCFIRCGNLVPLLYENGAAPKEIYTANTVLFAAMATMFVLAVLYYISLSLGSYQRLEQFITHTIRWERYSKEIDGMCKVFPKGYDPFNKKICNFVQGLHGTSLRVYGFLFFAVIAATCLAIYYSPCPCPCKCQCCETSTTCAACVLQTLFWVEFAAIIIFCYYHTNKKFTRYQEREKEYKDKGIGTI